MKNTWLGYDTDAKTFTFDDGRCNEIIKVNSISFYLLLRITNLFWHDVRVIMYDLSGERKVIGVPI